MKYAFLLVSIILISKYRRCFATSEGLLDHKSDSESLTSAEHAMPSFSEKIVKLSSASVEDESQEPLMSSPDKQTKVKLSLSQAHVKELPPLITTEKPMALSLSEEGKLEQPATSSESIEERLGSKSSETGPILQAGANGSQERLKQAATEYLDGVDMNLASTGNRHVQNLAGSKIREYQQQVDSDSAGQNPLSGLDTSEERLLDSESSGEYLPVGLAPSENQKNLLLGADYFRVDSSEMEEEDSALNSYFRQPLSGDPLTDSEKIQILAELNAGDLTQLLGTNPHSYQPDKYPDLGRRFVLQYPYKDVDDGGNAEHLKPKLAPPELVLAVAQESKLLEAATPNNPTDELIHKDILRTGNYWNSVWKEDVDPKMILRTSGREKLQSVKAKIRPGSDIYELVVKLKELSPKLIYVMNINDNN